MDEAIGVEGQGSSHKAKAEHDLATGIGRAGIGREGRETEGHAEASVLPGVPVFCCCYYKEFGAVLGEEESPPAAARRRGRPKKPWRKRTSPSAAPKDLGSRQQQQRATTIVIGNPTATRAALATTATGPTTAVTYRKSHRTPFAIRFRLLWFFVRWQITVTAAAAAVHNVNDAAVGAGTARVRRAHSILQSDMPSQRVLLTNTKRAPLFAAEQSATFERPRLRSYLRVGSNTAFVLSNNVPPSTNLQKQTLTPTLPHLSYRSHHRGRALFHSFSRHPPTRSSVESLASHSDDSHDAEATPASPPSTSSALLSPTPDESFQTHISFAEHVSHVIVPNITNQEAYGANGIDESNEVAATLTCEDVVRWVLRGAKERTNRLSDPVVSREVPSVANPFRPWSSAAEEANPDRRSRIDTEWTEGEAVSTYAKVLHPDYRHDPSLFPQDVADTVQPNLIAAELLALGSVWHLPYSVAKSKTDRADPFDGITPLSLTAGDWRKIGIKPKRLAAGDGANVARPGDYFRVHFDPRRHCAANAYDWGTADGYFADGDEENAKPGVIVSRDDDAGYIIVNKPPNVPVHARVDNVLENVAASVGRALWRERRAALLSDDEEATSRGNGKEDQATEAAATSSNTRTSKAGKRKNRDQKIEPLVYVATPQRLDQNTSG